MVVLVDMGLDRVMLCGLIVMCCQVKITCFIDAWQWQYGVLCYDRSR